jgi:hypothetical protein
LAIENIKIQLILELSILNLSFWLKCHSVALPSTLKKVSILRQKKKNYGNSNIFTMQKHNLQKKKPLNKTKILQNIITL